MFWEKVSVLYELGHGYVCFFVLKLIYLDGLYFLLCFTIPASLQFGTIHPNRSTNINFKLHTQEDGLNS